ncbi:helix-turn-helix domain-containing protein [Tahibacter harae]|uniref:Helix-turn-helix transcriptional regulator n=1 Tax=Tahibacter harae TaxID=2963937 RepID=A0ABT1QP95_9GAMM|nr:helix-turn-helix transcriptional regulator [Tahibacter harae]MCQ4164103.1 helix-turn-helix transcriptional regulator [Tahibacter harae]
MRALRAERGYSQEQRARICGLGRSYVGGAERVARNVSLVNIRKLANALMLSPGEFFE